MGYEVTRGDSVRFAQIQKQWLRNLESSTTTSTTFQKYTQEQILGYLQTPTRYQSQLIEASRYFYNNSPHYRRLIQYYASLYTYTYIIAPSEYNGTKKNLSAMRKTYYKVTSELERMQLEQECLKSATIALRDGACFGVIIENTDCWFVQYIDPTICVLSSVENGVWQYSIDCSKIRESELYRYPEEFARLWNEYRSDGIRLKEVPSDMSWCVKADETDTVNVIPPFIATVPQLYSIEEAKEIALTATQQNIYKLLNMTLPTDGEGKLLLDWDKCLEYYSQVAGVLPEYIGLSMTPFSLGAINFDKSAVDDNAQISDAERTFWQDAGVSSLLFGDASNGTAGALKLSVKADEAMVLPLLHSLERLINYHLSHISGGTKFKIAFLPVTIFNADEQISKYKDLATLGIPVKSHLSATAGLSQVDLMGMVSLENDVMDLSSKLIPLSSSYNTSKQDAGRPQKADEDLTDAGSKTRENDVHETDEV